MNDEIILTVMIPTYNRADCLKKVLVSLMNQTVDNFKIFISDNASDYDVNILLSELPDSFSKRCNIFKRKINCYADVNIFDLFTFCETKYMWTLSDDEYVHNDAVEKIYNYISKYPKVGVFNFTLSENIGTGGLPKVIKSIEEFIDFYYNKSKNNNKWHGDLIFLSNKVFNMHLVSDYVTWGYRYIYTRIATEVIFVKMLENEVPYCVVQDRIVDYNSDNQRSWKIYEVILGSRTLIDLPLEKINYDIRKLYSILIFDIRYVYYLYFLESPGDKNVPLFFDQIYHGIYKYCLNINQKCILKVISIITKNELGYRFCKWIYSKLYKAKEKLRIIIRKN